MKKRKHLYLLWAFVFLIAVMGIPFAQQKAFAQPAVPTHPAGIIITADRVESSLPVASLQNGETSNNGSQMMLRLMFQHSRIYGMTMKTELNTPTGPVTVTMTSSDSSQPVSLTNMKIDVTYLHFDGVYIPKLGELGMKNVTIIAHYQTAGDASIPNLNVQIDNGYTAAVPTAAEGFDLSSLFKLLSQLIADAKDGKLNGQKTPVSIIGSTIGDTIGQIGDTAKDTIGDTVGGILNPPSENDSTVLPNLPPVPSVPGIPDLPDVPTVPDLPIVPPVVNHIKDTLTATLQEIRNQLSQETSNLNQQVKDIQTKLADYQKQLADAESPLNKLLAPQKEKQVIQSIQSYLNDKSKTLNDLKSDANVTSQKASQLENDANANQVNDLLNDIKAAEAKIDDLKANTHSLISKVSNLQDVAATNPSSLLKSLGSFIGGVLDFLL